jgi:hypothetical protein
LRDGTKATNLGYNSIADRTRASTVSYVYRIQRQNYPNPPVSVDAYNSSVLGLLRTLGRGSYAFGIDFEEAV